jgi:hypothetical protein
VERLSRFFRLSRREQSLLLQAAVLLAAIRVGLRVLPFAQLRKLLGRLARTGTGTAHQAGGAREQIVWAVETAGRYFPSVGTCLTQALAMQVLLARTGCQSRLRIGVTRDRKGTFVAHAWLEKDGVILIGAAGHTEYSAMPALNGLDA